MDYKKLNNTIKAEADEILHTKGLLKILEKYGQSHVTGSYELNCMTWRDLDLYLINDNFDPKKFINLGAEISEILAAPKMNFRNELIRKKPGLPEGLYWGIYLGDERIDAWKIDIWQVNQSQFQFYQNHMAYLLKNIDQIKWEIIMAIKSQCCTSRDYRKKFNSQDIYSAVIEKNITNFEEFKKFISINKKIIL